MDMYYVANVIKYLRGDSYDEGTLISDIEETFKALKTKPFNNLFRDFYTQFNKFITRRRDEAYKFANIMMTDGFPYEYQNILEYYALPFRTSRNPIADKMIIEGVCNIKDLRLDQAIMSLLYDIEPNRFNRNQEFLNRMNFFFNYDPISFESIGNSQRLGRIGYMPEDPNQMISDYNWYKENKESPYALNIIGNYGEYMFYQYLLSIIRPEEYVMWVSHDLGDGFGYDIAVYNSLENKLYMYEIKSTDDPTKFENIYLSEHEKRVSNAVRENPQEEYHVVRLCLEQPFQMVDINDKSGNIKDITEPNRNRILINSNSGMRLL